MTSGLVDLFKHNAWANDRLIRALEQVEAPVLDATVPGTYGGVLNTMAHIVWAQERYLAAFSGGTMPFPSDVSPTLIEIGDRLRHDDEAFIKLAHETPDRMLRGLRPNGEPFALPAWLIYVQAINHATEHRAQIATILTQQGITPPGMDGWTYFAEMNDR
jgi:uncharacterized damage-inducible protein DinB